MEDSARTLILSYVAKKSATTTPTTTTQNNGGLAGGLKYLGKSLGAGVVGIGEGIYDFTVGGIAKAVGNDDYAEKLMANNIAGKIQQKAVDEFNPSSGWQFAGDIASGIGQSAVGAVVAAALVALAPATGGASLAIGGAAAGATIGLGAAGQSTAAAYQKTGELGAKEFGYGAASGLVEGALEGVTGAAGRVGTSAAKATARSMAKSITRKSIARGVLTDAAGEFVEESLSEIIDPMLQRATGVDENAENATAEQVLYAGLVGFFSGALMSGTTNAAASTSNFNRGSKAIKNGTQSQILAEAEEINKYVSQAENIKLIAPAYKDMAASLKAYNETADKTSTKAKLYLGEVQRGVARVESAKLVQSSKNAIIANPAPVVEWYAKQGIAVTAEDIVADKDGFATRLAINDVVGKTFLPDFTSRTLDTYIEKANKEFKKKGALSEDTNSALVDAYRQMERLGTKDNGATMKEEDYTFAQDHVFTQEEIKDLRDFADFMITKGLLAEDATDDNDRNMQNTRIRAALTTGKTTVAEVRAIKAVAKKMGIKVRFDNINDQKSQGSYKDNVLTIDVRYANGFSRVAAHEFIHHLAEHSTAKYVSVRSAILEVCEKNKQLKEVYDNAVAEYKSVIEDKDSAYYEEEAICRVVEQFISEFGSGEKGKLDLSKVGKEHIRSLRDFFVALKNRIKSYAVKKSNDSMTNVIKVLDEALSQKSNKKAVDSTTEARYSYRNDFANQIKLTTNKTPTSDPDIRHSLAGSISETADLAARDRALEMLIDGKTAQEIYAETGWLIGKDGYLRYEIDDSGMTSKPFIPNEQTIKESIAISQRCVSNLQHVVDSFNQTISEIEKRIRLLGKTEDAQWRRAEYRAQIQNYKREIKACEKSISKENGKITRELEEAQLSISLKSEADVERLFSRLVPKTTLGEIITHDELFAAYPFLKNLDCIFTPDEDSDATFVPSRDANGWVVPSRIEIGKSAFYSNGKFSVDRFLDTILHEVQHAIQEKEDFSAGTSTEAAKEKLISIAVADFNANPEKYKQYAETPAEWANIIADDAMAFHMYYNTYGEQEARNTAERRNLTKEERAKSMPFAGDKNSIFVENDFSDKNAGKLSLAEDKVLLDVPANERSSRKAAFVESAKDLKISFLNTWVNAQAGIEKYCKQNGIMDIAARTNFARSAGSAGNYMIGEELRPIFETVKKGRKYDKQYATHFMAYLLHWHNTDRMAEEVNKPVFGEEVSVEDSEAAIAEYDRVHPEFRALAEKVWAYNTKLLTMQLEGGLISQELFDNLQSTYPHYVPTYRDTKGGQTAGAVKGKGFVEINRSLKRAKGSDLEILPIDVMMARRTMQVFKAVRMNNVAAQLKTAAEADSNKSRVQIVGRRLMSERIDFDEYRPKDNQITYFEGGEAITIAVSTDIFTGFNAFSSDMYSEWNNPIMNFTSKWNSIFKKLVTAYNPFFTVRNALRDLQEAGLYTKNGWGTFLKNFAVAYKQIAFNGKWWKEYQEAGGLNSSVFDYDKGYKRTPSGFKKALEMIETVNIVVEQAPRLAEYISSREKGIGIEQSLLNAADVTVNFGRSGTFARKLNTTVIPFLNPSIQGFDKIARTIFSKKTVKEWIRLIVRAFLLGIAASMLNDMLLGDDEEYQALRQCDKENYFIIKVGAGKFLKLSKGRVSACISQFYYVGKQAAAGEDVDWKGELDNMRTNMSPTETASRFIWSPFTDAATNTTWYGSDIETAGDENLSPENRYNENTSSIAIWIGKAINYSPKKINYLLDQYSGVIGDIVLPLTTSAADKNVLEKSFVLDSNTQSDIGNDFYALVEEMTYAKNDGDYTAKAVLRYLNQAKNKALELSDQKKEIQNSDLSDSEKKAQVKTLQILMNNIYSTALTNASILEDELSRYEITDDTYESVYLQSYRNAFGAEAALKQYDENVYSTAVSMKSAGIEYETYFDAYFTIKATTSDKDKNGNTIEGSRKTKVTKYINSIKGLTKVQKAILLASAGYSLSNSLKVKVKQLGNSLSSEEKAELYDICGIAA